MPERFALVTLNQVDPFFHDGGSRSALNYLRALQAQGAEVCALSFVLQDYPQICFPDALADPGTQVQRENGTCAATFLGIRFIETILPIQISEQNVRQREIIRAMLQKLAEQKIDFVLTIGEGYVPLLAGCLQQLPGAHIFQSPPHIASFLRNQVYIPLLKTRIVITNSQFMQACVEKDLGIPALAWHPPHDLSQFQAGGTHPGTGVIGFSASQGQVKGTEIVTQLIPMLPEYQFVIAGTRFNPREITAPNLISLGHVTHMKDFYRQLDILIVPSVWEEAFGLVILEATANGLPVIANRRGGIPEALGDCGILVDFDPVKSDILECVHNYKQEIQRLLTDSHLYDTYREKSLVRARQFEQEKAFQARKMYELFHHIEQRRV